MRPDDAAAILGAQQAAYASGNNNADDDGNDGNGDAMAGVWGSGFGLGLTSALAAVSDGLVDTFGMSDDADAPGRTGGSGGGGGGGRGGGARS